MGSKLKIVADDFGYCAPRDKGIKALYDAGIIWGTSLLVNGASSREAVALASECGIRMGLHLNLTEGQPISDKEEVKSLLKEDSGLFGGKLYFREKCNYGRIKEDEVYKEIVAQIKLFQEMTGFLPKYVDGHQHVHITMPVRESFSRALKDYGISTTRLPIENIDSICNWIENKRKNFYQNVCRDAEECRQLFFDNGIRFSSHFFGMTVMGQDMTLERIRGCLQSIKEVISKGRVDEEHTIEFMTHPGYPCQEGVGGCGEGPDEFGCSKERSYELGLLASNAFRQMLQELNVDLLSGT